MSFPNAGPEMGITGFYSRYFISYFTLARPPPDAPHLSVHRRKMPQYPVDVFEYWVSKPDPISRLEWSGWGSFLYGYPSTGGVGITSPYPVYLQYLGLDRFTLLISPKETDPAAEDEFCNSMKKIGATWWRSHHAAGIEAESKAMSDSDSLPDHVYIGWPNSGGVWFSTLSERARGSTTLGMLDMALTMEEYCRVLETNGAVFHEDPKECEYLKDVV